MKIKFIPPSGGYGDTRCELDVLPHVGEVLNLGNWQGTVKQVVHIPEKYRKDDGISAHIELEQVHTVQDASQAAPGESSAE